MNLSTVRSIRTGIEDILHMWLLQFHFAQTPPILISRMVGLDGKIHKEFISHWLGTLYSLHIPLHWPKCYNHSHWHIPYLGHEEKCQSFSLDSGATGISARDLSTSTVATIIGMAFSVLVAAAYRITLKYFTKQHTKAVFQRRREIVSHLEHFCVCCCVPAPMSEERKNVASSFSSPHMV